MLLLLFTLVNIEPKKEYSTPIRNNSVRIKDSWVRVNSISLTKGDSKPTWEDPINANGWDFSSVISGMQDAELKDLWTQLVIYSVGGIHKYHKNVWIVYEV